MNQWTLPPKQIAMRNSNLSKSYFYTIAKVKGFTTCDFFSCIAFPNWKQLKGEIDEIEFEN